MLGAFQGRRTGSEGGTTSSRPLSHSMGRLLNIWLLCQTWFEMQLGSCWGSTRILCPPKQIIILLQSRISSSRVEFGHQGQSSLIGVLKAALGRYLLEVWGVWSTCGGAAVCSIGELRLGVDFSCDCTSNAQRDGHVDWCFDVNQNWHTPEQEEELTDKREMISEGFLQMVLLGHQNS